MKSFHLICNMPMFLEENLWKSPQVFRSHLKSFGSQKSVNSCFYPKVQLSNLKKSLLALFLVPKQLLQSFSLELGPYWRAGSNHKACKRLMHELMSTHGKQMVPLNFCLEETSFKTMLIILDTDPLINFWA